jgi:hypothetical protein
MSTDYPDSAASVNIGASYRARCTEAGCKNLGRLLFIYADAGGRPISHPVLCHAHGRVMLARDRAGGSRFMTFAKLLMIGRLRPAPGPAAEIDYRQTRPDGNFNCP